MRLIIIAVLLILAVWIFVLGWRNQKRISWFGVFLMLLPAGAFGYFEYKWLEPQEEITLVVQDVARTDAVDFKCQRLSTGFFDAEISKKVIQTSKTTVELKYSTCKALVDWYLAEPNLQSKPSEEAIVALHSLSQEIMRVAGNSNSRIIECLAAKNNATIAQKLGASTSTANYMSLYYQQNLQDESYSRSPVSC